MGQWRLNSSACSSSMPVEIFTKAWSAFSYASSKSSGSTHPSLSTTIPFVFIRAVIYASSHSSRRMMSLNSLSFLFMSSSENNTGLGGQGSLEYNPHTQWSAIASSVQGGVNYPTKSAMNNRSRGATPPSVEAAAYQFRL